jgi:hypothetical protein
MIVVNIRRKVSKAEYLVNIIDKTDKISPRGSFFSRNGDGQRGM